MKNRHRTNGFSGYRNLFSALTIALLSNATMAVEPSQCVEPIDLPGGGMGLKNICTKKINIAFCVENPRSQWACPKGRNAVRGTYDVAKDRHIAIQGYSFEGGGTVHAIACLHPEAPGNWNLERKSFTCR